MAEVPTTNAAAAKFNELIVKVGGSLRGFVQGVVETKLPWLKLPGLKQIFEGLLGWLFGEAEEFAQVKATDTVIDSQITSEVKAVLDAKVALRAAYKSGDPVAIRKAIQDYADAFSAAVHYDGAAPPK